MQARLRDAHVHQSRALKGGRCQGFADPRTRVGLVPDVPEERPVGIPPVERGDGAAVVYTSHYLAEFEELGSDIAILNEGRIVASGTLEEIVSHHARAEVTLEFDHPVPSIDGWNTDGRRLKLIGDEADPGSRIGEALASPALEGARLTDVRITQASLHNAYLQIIKESDHVAA